APKVELFKLLHDWMLKFYLLRDDERFHSDRGTYAKKKHLVEIGRRLVDRGVLTNEDDFWYLSKKELYRLLDGATANMRISHAKIDARRRNCDEMEGGARRPMYINGDSTIAAEGDDHGSALGDDGVLRGTGTSRGTYVGTARVIGTQKEMGRVKKGEILVCFATDPGWTSVFMVAGAAIFETGGILAHCSCISREYGIPAVQIVNATKLIEDGSTIEVNGDTGEVRILAGPVLEPELEAVPA
ncbi:MAG TPA: PEP-utilizing enzyme, partial [Opitutaceae bacterium]